MEKILPLAAGTRVQMKKKHPCGASAFLVLRAGADVKARCSGCGREMLVSRVRFERAVKKILPDLAVQDKGEDG